MKISPISGRLFQGPDKKMKKILIAPLLLFVVFFISCAGKKDRLTADTLVMTIEPTQVIVGKNTKTTLTAITHNSGSVTNVEITPVWAVVNTGLGSFSPGQGKTVSFNSGTLLGSTTIYAQYGAARAVGFITVSDVAQNNAVPAGEFDIYREIPMLQNAESFLIGMLNPPNKFGGGLYKFAWNDNPAGDKVKTVGLSAATGMLGDDHTEGSKGLKVDIGNYPGGIYFQFGDDGNTNPQKPTDLSAYSSCYLVFDVKTTPGVDLAFYIQFGRPYPNNYQVSDVISRYGTNMLDGNWHTVSVKITSLPGATVDFAHITVPFLLESAPSGTNTNFTFYVDNVRWQQ